MSTTGIVTVDSLLCDRRPCLLRSALCTIWYMLTETTIEIDAPASIVWQVYTDVEAWPEWTASIISVEPLDGAELAVGRHFAITQPRFPRLVWEITDLEPGTAWVWRQRSPGGTTLAGHRVEALDGERTLVRQTIDQRGPVGTVVGLLARRLTRRYLDLEATGLKTTAEAARSPCRRALTPGDDASCSMP